MFSEGKNMFNSNKFFKLVEDSLDGMKTKGVREMENFINNVIYQLVEIHNVASLYSNRCLDIFSNKINEMPEGELKTRFQELVSQKLVPGLAKKSFYEPASQSNSNQNSQIKSVKKDFLMLGFPQTNASIQQHNIGSDGLDILKEKISHAANLMALTFITAKNSNKDNAIKPTLDAIQKNVHLDENTKTSLITYAKEQFNHHLSTHFITFNKPTGEEREIFNKFIKIFKERSREKTLNLSSEIKDSLMETVASSKEKNPNIHSSTVISAVAKLASNPGDDSLNPAIFNQGKALAELEYLDAKQLEKKLKETTEPLLLRETVKVAMKEAAKFAFLGYISEGSEYKLKKDFINALSENNTLKESAQILPAIINLAEATFKKEYAEQQRQRELKQQPNQQNNFLPGNKSQPSSQTSSQKSNITEQEQKAETTMSIKPKGF